MHKWSRSFILFVLGALISTSLLAQQNQNPTKDLYYFVIDKSKSIKQNNLFDPILTQVTEYVKKLPSDTEVRLVFFSDSATTEQSWYPMTEQAKADFSKNFTENFRCWGATLLYETVADVLNRVIADEAKYRGIRVIILSDGEDNKSDRKKFKEGWKNLEKMMPEGWTDQRKGFSIIWETLGDFKINPDYAPTPGGPIRHVTVINPNEIIIHFDPPPKASFTAKPEKAKVNEPILFALDDDTGVTTVSWAFGDGKTSNKKTDTHTYGAERDYDIEVKLEGPGGKTSVIKKSYVHIIKEIPLEAKFSWYPEIIRENQPVKFSDESLGSPASWNWEFVGIGPKTERNPMVSFPNVGKTSVTLTIEKEGLKSVARKDIPVIPQPPTSVEFSVEPSTAQIGQTIKLSSQNAKPGETHKWIIAGDIIKEGPQTTWPADRTGRVEVVHAVQNAGGLVEKKDVVFVNPEPEPLVAKFKEPTEVHAGETVQFADESLGAPKSWLWDIAGVGVFRERNPKVAFKNIGSATVKLTIERDGRKNVVQKDIPVLPQPPSAEFTVEPDTAQIGQTIKLSSQNAKPGETHKWTIAGDIIKEGPQTTWTADRKGRIEVVHAVQNAGGRDEQKNVIFVNLKPEPLVAKFTWLPPEVHANETIYLSDESLGAPKSWLWDIAGVGVFKEHKPKVTFKNAGPVTVKLTIERDGRNDTTQKEITVLPTVIITNITAKFTVTPLKGRAPLTVQFTDKSTGPIARWQWEFGDGKTSTEKNPLHEYDAAKIYKPRLTIHTSVGEEARDAGLITITVVPPPAPMPLWIKILLWLVGALIVWVFFVNPLILKPLIAPQKGVVLRGTRMYYLKQLAGKGASNFLWPRNYVTIGTGKSGDINVGGVGQKNEILARVSRIPITNNYELTVFQANAVSEVRKQNAPDGQETTQTVAIVPGKPRLLRDGDQVEIRGTLLTWIQPGNKKR